MPILRNAIPIVLLQLISGVIPWANCARADVQSSGDGPVEIGATAGPTRRLPPEAQTRLEIATPMAPPRWALQERRLLEENTRFAEAFAEKYVNPETGYFECVEAWGGGDGPDDVMESFYNWPLLYVLGAPKSTLDRFKFIWNGHIKQYSNLGMYHREFITSFDWEHNGEGYAAFLLLPLADPEGPLTQQRIIRFADFYTGRDTTTRNYDPEHRIIRSILNGSKGPTLEATIDDWGGQDYWRDSGDWTRVKGDVCMNLISTSLATNAYILTGDEHYRRWVREYVGAWRERTVANDGIVPSNIGLNGRVGEHWEGKWYGGLMGWNWVFGGWGVLGRAVRIGFGNAYFVTGDGGFIDVLRTQGDVLLENREDLQFPNRFGDDGWRDYSASPLFGSLFADVYMWSLEERDLKRLYDAYRLTNMRRSGIYEQGNEIAWIEFLEGENPDYPSEALSAGFARLRRNIEGIRNDDSSRDTRRADTPYRKGTMGAATSALVNLTMGGIQPLWAGGLLHCQLRYFDPVRRRPGLPDDVAALVTDITNDTVEVTLVNVSRAEARDVVVQTGAYGEHQCERAEIGGEAYPVGHRFFHVRLAPGAGAELVIYRTRFANKPTFAFPWRGDKAPPESKN